MGYLDLLQRTDYYEISGNKMTSYCSTLGGGSIKYWDGKRVSFDPAAPQVNMSARPEGPGAEYRRCGGTRPAYSWTGSR